MNRKVMFTLHDKEEKWNISEWNVSKNDVNED